MIERIVGLDLGMVRIGVAVSDPLGTFAQGVAQWDARSDWLCNLGDLLRSTGASTVVVGLPIREDGTRGPSALKVEENMRQIRETFPDVTIIPVDERYSSTIANQVLIQGDLSRKKRRAVVDKLAASVILQTYLDTRRTVEP